MRPLPRAESLWQCALALSVGLAAAGCGGPLAPTAPNMAPAPALGPDAPPRPVPGPPPGPPISVLAIKAVTVNGNELEIAPTITLAETGGRGDALVTSITFNLADGIPWPRPLECAYGMGTRVEAGAESTIQPEVNGYGDYMWSFSVPRDYTGRLEVAVTYEDAEGRRGTVRSLVALPWAS